MEDNATLERLVKDVRPTKPMVCELLQMTELEYGQMQYDEGMRYLNAYIPDDDWGQDILLRSCIFWNWWKNHWELRDRCFIHISSQESCGLYAMRQVYAQSNDGASLATKVHPNGAIMEESYAEMINRFNKSITQ